MKKPWITQDGQPNMNDMPPMTTDPLRQAALADGIEDRLTYADWLEERGDPLGEIIRRVCSIRIHEHDRMGEGDGCADCQMHWGYLETKLIPAVLAPLLATIAETYRNLPRCSHCDGNRVQENPIGECTECDGWGRIGKLWRSCPECDATDEVHDCTRCSGYGVLLEIECRNSRSHPQPPDPTNLRLHCVFCDGAGYIPSPLVELWEVLALTFDPCADQVRRGDVAAILGLLSESKQ